MNVYKNIIHWLEQHQLPCLFRKCFDIDCPGCGLQRSTLALLKGQVWESLKWYPALLPMLLFFIFLAINKFYNYRFSTKVTQTGISILILIILASYIFKLTFKKNCL